MAVRSWSEQIGISISMMLDSTSRRPERMALVRSDVGTHGVEEDDPEEAGRRSRPDDRRAPVGSQSGQQQDQQGADGHAAEHVGR